MAAIVSVYPWFEVPEGDVGKFEDLFDKFYELTKNEAGKLYYGFARCGNKIHCREAYTSADAVLAHLKNVDAPLQVAGAYLKSLEFHGPKAELDKLKEPTAAFRPTMFVLENDEEVKTFESLGTPTTDTMVNIAPYFEVPDSDVAEFQGYIRQFLDLTNTEQGVLFHGFTRAENKFHCRESYKSAEDALAHLKNVNAPLSKAAKWLKSLAIMGPKAEIEKMKPTTEALFGTKMGTTYWTLDVGAMSRILPASSAIVSVYPWFAVPEGDVGKFEDLFSKFYELTKTETGMIHYGFAKSGNKFHCREAYTSADAVLAHLKNVDSPLQVAGAYLKSLEFHGPKAELDKLKEPTAAFSPTMFVLENDTEVKKYEVGGRPKPDTMLNIVPYFEVPDSDVPEFQGYIREFLDLTSEERGVLNYGFTRAGNKFHCRESYRTAGAGLAHLKNVNEPLSKAAKWLKTLAIMGPEAEIEKMKPATEALGTTYWALDEGSMSRIVPGGPKEVSKKSLFWANFAKGMIFCC